MGPFFLPLEGPVWPTIFHRYLPPLLGFMRKNLPRELGLGTARAKKNSLYIQTGRTAQLDRRNFITSTSPKPDLLPFEKVTGLVAREREQGWGRRNN